jgi:hypothetical protein
MVRTRAGGGAERLVDRHAMSGGTAVGMGVSPAAARACRIRRTRPRSRRAGERVLAGSSRSLILTPLVVETSWLSGNLRSRQIGRRMGIQYAYCRNILRTWRVYSALISFLYTRTFKCRPYAGVAGSQRWYSLPLILPRSNTDIFSIKICLDIYVFAKDNIGWNTSTPSDP